MPKNSVRKGRHDRCRVELAVEGDCDRTDLEIEIIRVVWFERLPGRTSSRMRKMTSHSVH